MNKAPKKAMILAAGLGQRLQPLTAAMPKPLMPLWNKPLIDHVIHLLQSWGVQQIVVNTHWQPEKIAAHLAAGSYTAGIQLSEEQEIRGTAGALRGWREYFSDEPFWVINGDIAAELDCRALINGYYSQPRPFGACWVTDKKGPRTVEVDRLGRITCYRSPEPGVEGTYTFCGLQLLSPKIFDFIPERTFSTLVEAYENAMFQNLFVKGVTVEESYWNDAGTLERYREIHRETKQLARAGQPGGGLYNAGADRKAESSRGFLCAGAGAVIKGALKGNNSIIFDGVTLEEQSSVSNAIIQGGHLAGRISDLCCVSGSALSEKSVVEAAKALGWESDGGAFAFLGQRGSERSFWRGLYRHERAIFICDGGGRPENRRYAGHTGVLQRAGIPVPELRYNAPDGRTLAVEDLGDQSLQDRMASSPENAEDYYRNIIAKAADFHRQVTKVVNAEKIELEPAFDQALYSWEHALFEEHMLQRRYGFEGLPAAVLEELVNVAAELERGSQAVIHRDLQSSNILFKGRKFFLIDFQGMRYGSPAYDLASLLYDPYVDLDPKLRCVLAAAYCQAVPEFPDVLQLFFKAAVQRLVQSLGAFGRLAALGHTTFEQHIAAALKNLLEAADAAELDALGGLVEELIAREQIRQRSFAPSTNCGPIATSG
ncbi:MAG: sugar phosphate nucleotidyltransferase [Kiritimatiellae bacterium]|nr:sugar phosphate nucleotidyltransferase [Kiritimatiellia bacterium]